MEYAVYKMIGSEGIYMFAVGAADVDFVLGNLKKKYPSERFVAMLK